MDARNNGTSDRKVFDEIQLLLDEKRTSVSVMSTGIFILLVQLTILGILIATSQFYKLIDVLHIVIPFYIMNVALVCLSFYLIVHSLLRIRNYNRWIQQLKEGSGWFTKVDNS